MKRIGCEYYCSEAQVENNQVVKLKTILRKEQVHTGRRTMEYIELVGSDLTREDYIAFPYGKAVRDGASVEITDDI